MREPLGRVDRSGQVSEEARRAMRERFQAPRTGWTKATGERLRPIRNDRSSTETRPGQLTDLARNNQLGRGPLRQIMQQLSPVQRNLALDYLRGLDEDQRRSLFLMIQRAPEERKPVVLMETVESGKPPVTAREILAKAGVKAASDLPPLIMNQRSTTSAQFSIRLSAGSGTTSALPPVGSQLLALHGTTLQGHPVDPKQFQGKFLVIQVGSLTSPRYRASIPAARALKERFGNRIQLVTIYTREAHPSGATSPFASSVWVPQANVRDAVLVSDSQTLNQRYDRAKALNNHWGDLSFMVVDAVENELWQALGCRSHALILSDDQGEVIHASDPADFISASRILDKAIGTPKR